MAVVTPIGQGTHYEARLIDRFSSAASSAVPVMVSLKRTDAGYSTHTASFLSVDETVEPWSWNLEVLREGQREAIGPVVAVQWSGDLVRVSAWCLLGWTRVRRMRTSRSLVDVSPSAALAVIIGDALGIAADPIPYGLRAPADDRACSVAWDASDGVYASTLIERLWSDEGLVGGTMRDAYTVPTSTPVARLTASSFVDTLTTELDGLTWCSHAYVRGLHESRQWPLDDTRRGPLVDYTVDRNTAKTSAAVRAAARHEWEKRGRVVPLLGTGASALRLSPQSGIDPAVLAPGATVTVDVDTPRGPIVATRTLNVIEFTLGSDTNPARAGGKFASDAQVATEFVEVTLS